MYANALPVKISPSFEERANVAMTRSISPGVAHADRSQLHPKRWCHVRHKLNGATFSRARYQFRGKKRSVLSKSYS
jgi:hypothetical protein